MWRLRKLKAGTMFTPKEDDKELRECHEKSAKVENRKEYFMRKKVTFLYLKWQDMKYYLFCSANNSQGSVPICLSTPPLSILNIQYPPHPPSWKSVLVNAPCWRNMTFSLLTKFDWAAPPKFRMVISIKQFQNALGTWKRWPNLKHPLASSTRTVPLIL